MELTEIIEATWDCIAVKGSRTVEAEDICKGLRALCKFGGFTTEKDLQEIKNQQKFSKSDFISIMNKRISCAPPNFSEFLAGQNNPLNKIDPDGTNKLTGKQLQEILCSMGNNLSPREVSNFYKYIGFQDPGGNFVDKDRLFKSVKQYLVKSL